MDAIVEKVKGLGSGFLVLIFSKRAVAAAVTAFFVTHAQGDGVEKEPALAVAGIVVGVIFGDSMRPINPDKVTDG